MSTPSVWSKSMPYVKDGDPVKAAVTNAPAQVLSDRTEALRAMLSAIQAGQQVMLRDAPLAAGTGVGDVLYFKAGDLVSALALAQWKELGPTAELSPAESAVYLGLLVSKTADRVGDVLCAGFATLQPVDLLRLFGTVTPALGTHYLSMTTPGTVQHVKPAMAVRVLEYMGSGLIRVYLPEAEPITHTHRTYRLQSDSWLGTGSFDPLIVPAGAVFGYNLAAVNAVEQNLGEALLPVNGQVEFHWLYHNVDLSPSTSSAGLHLDETAVLVNADGIWWMDTVLDPDADIEMVCCAADTKGVSVVSAIRSLSPETLRITSSNGLVSVTLLDFAADTGVAGSVVVKEISGGRQRRGPVVEKILAGRNTSVSPGGQGSVTVSFDAVNDELMEATVQNLNNAITSVEDPHVLTIFPKNRLSSVACRVNLPNLGTAAYKARVWALFMSPAPAQACPSVTLTMIPSPTPAGVTPVGPTALSLPALPGTVVAGNVYYVETAEVDLRTPNDFSRGIASFSLTVDSPVQELKMVSAGLRVYL